jgi:hypothetical protein
MRDIKPAFAIAITQAVVFALLITGCGASRMERMTMAAGALHSVAGGAAGMIDRAAELRAREAVDACTGTAQECEAAALAAVEPLEAAQAAQHLFAASVDTYISAVITAAQTRDPNWADALRHLGDAFGMYEALREILAEFGIQAPTLPAIIHNVMGDLQ